VLACLNQPALVASRRAGEVSGLADLRRAVDLLAECGDRHGQAIALRTIAHALRRQGHLTQALALFHEALTHYEASGDTVGRWQALRFTGQTLLDLGNHAGAHRALAEAKAVAGEIGDRRLIAQARYWAGEACLAGGDLDGAQAEFDVVFAMCRDDTGLGHAYAVHGLSDLARYRGNYDVAGRYLAEAASLVRDGADALLEGRVLLSTAALCQAQGQLDEQLAALEQAAGVFAGCGAVYLEAPALAALAGALAGRGDAEAASAAWDRIEGLYNAAGLPDEDRIHRRPDR
jgi:tetratricopeptide (TPR) repeat protein